MGFVPPPLPPRPRRPPPLGRGDTAPLFHICSKCGAQLLIESVTYTPTRPDDQHSMFPEGKMEVLLSCPDVTWWRKKLIDAFFLTEHDEVEYTSDDGGAAWHIDLGVKMRM